MVIEKQQIICAFSSDVAEQIEHFRNMYNLLFHSLYIYIYIYIYYPHFSIPHPLSLFHRLFVLNWWWSTNWGQLVNKEKSE